MRFHSPAFISVTQRTILATGLMFLVGGPNVVSAATFASPSHPFQGSLALPTATSAIDQVRSPWLMADKDDDDDDKEEKRGKKDQKVQDRDQNQDQRLVRIDLNRAKNLARQAAESANGGIRVYRAEASMHGSAALCPYVDNGDSWTFTFLGGRPGVTVRTIESVVTVYKNSPRVVVAYNGAIRSGKQTQWVSFTSEQRTVLIDLLRGNCGCNYLLTESVRTQISTQVRSLPPGIQKQLARGKGLPPGWAKKVVVLPKQVNTYVKLPTQYDLLVVGSQLVVVDQVRSVVVDWVSYAL